MSQQIAVENVNTPGTSFNVDAAKYTEMRTQLLAVLPKREPGMLIAELTEAVKPRLSQELFPGGATCGWWLKCVQLDLEAKRIIRRADTAPVRLWKL